MEHSSSPACKIAPDSGYTIIEVLIAIAIFSIGIMALGMLQARSLMSTSEITEKTEAWAILEDQAETLKAMPFYANDDGLNNDGDGTTDEVDEEIFPVNPGDPTLVAGNYNAPRAGGRYTVHWQVVNDVPIPQQDPTMVSLPGVPAGTYTVSKTVSVQVTRTGDDPATEALATVEFVKTWAAHGIP